MNNFNTNYSSIYSYMQSTTPAPAPSSQTTPPGLSEKTIPGENGKKFNKVDIAAVCLAALSMATAGVCLYRTGKSKKAADALQQALTTMQGTLQKTQGDLVDAQNSLAAFQKTKQTMIEHLLFPNGVSGIQFRQSNIGDCYLLSSIYGLSKNKKGQELLKNMVTITDDGDFLVKFHNQNPILVRAGELKGQSTQEGLKRTIYGDIGLQAIECAYGKYRSALSGGVNKSLLAIDGGLSSDALNVLGGLSSNTYGNVKGAFSKQGLSVSSLLDGIADNFGNRIICVSTPPAKYGAVQATRRGETIGWMDPKRQYICGHAYNVTNIDKTNKLVTVANPHNTMQQQMMTYDRFEKIFGRLFETTI